MANQFDPNQAVNLFGFNDTFTTSMYHLGQTSGPNHLMYPGIENPLVQYLLMQQQDLRNQYSNLLLPVWNFVGVVPQTPQNNPTAALQQLENHQGDEQDESLSVSETSEEAMSDSEGSLSSLPSTKDVIEDNQKPKISPLLHADLLRELENQGNAQNDNPVPPSPGPEENADAVVPPLIQLPQASAPVEKLCENSVEIPNYEVDLSRSASGEKKNLKKNKKKLLPSSLGLEKETRSDGVVVNTPKRKNEEGETSEQNKRIKVVLRMIKKELVEADSSEIPGSAPTPPAASEETSPLSGHNCGSKKQKKQIVFKLKNGPCVIRAVLGSDVTSPPENVTIEDLRTPEQVARDARRLRRAAEKEAKGKTKGEAEAANLIPENEIKKEVEDDEKDEDRAAKNKCGTGEFCIADPYKQAHWAQCINCAQWYHVFCLTQSNREYQKAFFCCDHPSAGMAMAAKKGVVFNNYWSVPNPRKMKSSSSARVPLVTLEE
ncbi:hypothetical protein B9Z55_026490 [Caenorhabditis nigoni]|uniref:Zinc finger PHD-type domain-containing protein n=1 Tax=Caenorhabditis nigoni TaxID=1611254 RepID=A0A2G5T3N5_9PELO|nr:hypothetical protein B9Z55_026490 [Caenorhabditis nigoni]